MVVLWGGMADQQALLAAGLLERPPANPQHALATQIAMVQSCCPNDLRSPNALRQIDPSLARAASGGLGRHAVSDLRQVICRLSMPASPRGVCWSSCWRWALHHARLVGGPREITLRC